MSNYAWIIDRDYAPDGSPGTYLNATGLTGPRNASQTALAALADGLGVRFRMLDDDGGLTYAGRFVGDHESEDGFGPLDDFGTPNAGCTSIEYWLNGQWEQL